VGVPLLDLKRQAAEVQAEVARRVEAVFSTQQFILGQTVEAFEAEFAEAFGFAHAVAMSSGTDAQLALLIAHGIGAGDAVITSPYTFFATAGSVRRCGAEILFADIRQDTMHLNPSAVENLIRTQCETNKEGKLVTASGNLVRALIPVHLFGSVCEMAAFQQIADTYNLRLIEDAAQAVGAQFPTAGGSKFAGDIAEAAFFSFFPTKNLGGAGDGGMAVCQSKELAERLRQVRNHGMSSSYQHEVVGGNFRLDALQAAVLSAKLPHLANWNARRRDNAQVYHTGLRDLAPQIILPSAPWQDSGLDSHHTYHQYVIRAQRRDELRAFLSERGIGSAIYYPRPLHLQPCFADLGYQPGDLPNAECASAEALALPIFAEVRAAELREVIAAIREFVGAAS